MLTFYLLQCTVSRTHSFLIVQNLHNFKVYMEYVYINSYKAASLISTA